MARSSSSILKTLLITTGSSSLRKPGPLHSFFASLQRFRLALNRYQLFYHPFPEKTESWANPRRASEALHPSNLSKKTLIRLSSEFDAIQRLVDNLQAAFKGVSNSGQFLVKRRQYERNLVEADHRGFFGNLRALSTCTLLPG